MGRTKDSRSDALADVLGAWRLADFLPRLRVYGLTPRRYTSVKAERRVRP